MKMPFYNKYFLPILMLTNYNVQQFVKVKWTVNIIEDKVTPINT